MNIFIIRTHCCVIRVDSGNQHGSRDVCFLLLLLLFCCCFKRMCWSNEAEMRLNPHSCACAQNRPDHPWRGRTRDWDTTQRLKSVLQAKRNASPAPYHPPPRSVFLLTAVVTRWCCKGMLDPCSAGSGMRMRERATHTRVIFITQGPSDWWRL